MATNDAMMTAAWRAFQAGDLDRAERAYRQVLDQDPTAAHAWYMLGAIGQVRGRVEESVANYREAIRLSPDFPEACNNLGVALHALQRGEEAIDVLRRALALRPDYRGGPQQPGQCAARARRLRRGRGLLSTGDRPQSRLCGGPPQPRQRPAFRGMHGRGDRELRPRRGADARPRHRPPEPRPWPARDGGLPAGMARVRVAAEVLAVRAHAIHPADLGRAARSTAGRSCSTPTHGLGDAIQFIRYAPMVRERCGRVIVACAAPLARLLATCAGVDLVVVAGAPLPEFDVYAPLMSLPGIFGTDAASIPADVPYLSADPELVRARAEQLPASDEFCIGIAWQGNPAYSRDHLRSIPLERFEPVAHGPA